MDGFRVKRIAADDNRYPVKAPSSPDMPQKSPELALYSANINYYQEWIVRPGVFSSGFLYVFSLLPDVMSIFFKSAPA
ncbi:MAG: hypothetical protein KAT58_02835 [candidate division Zixibacteria bacterium]|nr:hypothetical protein [candidate division Zixibacteria bacterium]